MLLTVKNLFDTLNVEIITCTVRQCIYTRGSISCLFVTLSHSVIPTVLCDSSCCTLQSMPHFLIYFATLINSKAIALCNLPLSQFLIHQLVALCNLFCNNNNNNNNNNNSNDNNDNNNL